MSDLGNRGRTNSMKFGEDIDLDELLLNPVLFVVVLSSFQFLRESPILGSQSTKLIVLYLYKIIYSYLKIS